MEVALSALSSPRPPGPPSRPGRPRQQDVDRRLHAAVLSLLRAGGPAAVTVEAAAVESGVAKTTIYRRYRNRGELLRAALTNAIGTPQPLGEGSVRDKLRFAIEEVWRQMADVLGPGGLAALVTNGEPELTDLFRTVLQPFDDALVARLEDDAAAGLLRDDVDAEGVVSLLVGAYLGELVRRGRVDETWTERCLEMIWAMLVPRGG